MFLKFYKSDFRIYAEKHFPDYSIDHDYPTNGGNKILLLSKGNEQFILKIISKKRKRAYREIGLLKELQSQLPVPDVISTKATILARHVLMPYYGRSLYVDNETTDYINLGRLAYKISTISITNAMRKVLRRPSNKKIECFIQQQGNHSYLRYLKYYSKFPQNYFSHRDFLLKQVMMNGGDLRIIDWESASTSFRIYDLACVMSDALILSLSEDQAKIILAGFEEETIIEGHERKFLIGLIWWNLNRYINYWSNNPEKQKHIDFLQPYLHENLIGKMIGDSC